MANIDYTKYGFKHEQNVTLRTCTFSLWIVRHQHVLGGADYAVHIFHGIPAGQFWRDQRPIHVTDTLEHAREYCTRIWGIVGSGEFAQAVNADGSPLDSCLNVCEDEA